MLQLSSCYTFTYFCKYTKKQYKYKYKEASENPATCDSPKLFVKITISGSTSMI